MENQIVDGLLKEAQLTVPQTLVKKQLEHRRAELRNRLKSQGLPEDDIQKKEEEFRKEIQTSVEKDVRIYLIFDKIAQVEGLTVKKEESLPAKVMEFLLKEANWEEKGDLKQ